MCPSYLFSGVGSYAAAGGGWAKLVGGGTLELVSFPDCFLPHGKINFSLHGKKWSGNLPCEISSAPGIFQKAMQSLLQGIPHVTVYLKNILILGETEADYLQSLEQVLERLAKAGLRVQK